MVDLATWTMIKRYSAGGLLVALCAACTTTSDTNATRDYGHSAALRSGTGAVAAQDNDAESNRAVHTDLIRGMLAQGQYYAALAHIEDQKRAIGDTRELRSLEADARRKLGQIPDAVRLYNGLLDTEFDGDAHHGLGLIAFKTDRVGAVQHLRKAVQRRPTDAQFRNDLGYALMESGSYKEALPQLATAVELDPSISTARNNLVVLLILSGDEVRAKQVVQDSGISEEAFAGLRRRAQALNPSKAPTGQKR